MLKPICVPCERFYRPEKNGFRFLEGMPIVDGAVPGKDRDAASWADYKLWFGDKWRCPGCGHEIVQGALHPVAEHFQEGFAELVKACKPAFRVNDC